MVFMRFPSRRATSWLAQTWQLGMLLLHRAKTILHVAAAEAAAQPLVGADS